MKYLQGIVWVIALVFFAWFLMGCTTTREIIQTRIDTLTVVTPTQYDTVTIHDTQSGYEGETVKYILRVDTLVKRAYVTAKPETLYVQHVDTVTVISAAEPEPWYKRANGTLYAVGFLALCIGALYLIFKR